MPWNKEYIHIPHHWGILGSPTWGAYPGTLPLHRHSFTSEHLRTASTWLGNSLGPFLSTLLGFLKTIIATFLWPLRGLPTVTDLTEYQDTHFTGGRTKGRRDESLVQVTGLGVWKSHGQEVNSAGNHLSSVGLNNHTWAPGLESWTD